MTPDEVHEVGKKEVDRIKERMLEVAFTRNLSFIYWFSVFLIKCSNITKT